MLNQIVYIHVNVFNVTAPKWMLNAHHRVFELWQRRNSYHSLLHIEIQLIVGDMHYVLEHCIRCLMYLYTCERKCSKLSMCTPRRTRFYLGRVSNRRSMRSSGFDALAKYSVRTFLFVSISFLLPPTDICTYKCYVHVAHFSTVA